MRTLFDRKHSLLFLVSILFGMVWSQYSQAKTAKQLFANLQQQVYQIRVIDVASDNKSSIGSGFLVSKQGYLATNFHVVSEYVHEPDKYRLEYVQHDGSTGPAELITINIVHDLAILQIESKQKHFFKLQDRPLSKGDRVYSMGNPHDLGLTIVEGNYNGLIELSRHPRILFSGSLNPGMSGGPALNDEGEVIGINVSKGGEQISFLVPVLNLKKLMQRASSQQKQPDFTQLIRDDLYSEQDTFYTRILESELVLEPFGDLKLPEKMADSLKCWGHTLDDEEDLFSSFHRHCRTEDQIFVRSGFYTSNFSYDYEWITTDELNRFQFYTAVKGRFQHNTISSAPDKKHITNYSCHNDFIKLAGHEWKISSCFRAYKKYQGLYDALLLIASADINDKAAVIKVGVSGINRSNALALFKKISEAIQWAQ